ncbi:MAG: hypothetical protein ACPF9D_08570, partial [Owenweeksia sp.]
MEIKRLIGIAAILLTIAGCKQGQLPFLSQTYPHQDYGNQLKKQGLQDTHLGRQWLQQAQTALENPVSIDIPFALNGVFHSGTIEALAWKFNLKRGTSLNVLANWQSPDSSKLFMDIFFLEAGTWKHLEASEENKYQLNFESDENGEYLLRVQPELLGEGRFNLKIQQAPTYSVFPVQGKDSRAIWSVFGVD